MKIKGLTRKNGMSSYFHKIMNNENFLGNDPNLRKLYKRSANE